MMCPKCPESYKVAGLVLRMLPNERVLIELQQNLAIGEIIQFKSRSGLTERVVSLMEDEQGQARYQAMEGERVALKLSFRFQPGDQLKKLPPGGCLKVEAFIEPADICFLNGVMEGYNDLAVLRTLDASQGLVELIGADCYEEEIDKALLSLRKQMPRLEIKAVINGSALMEL